MLKFDNPAPEDGTEPELERRLRTNVASIAPKGFQIKDAKRPERSHHSVSLLEPPLARDGV